MHFYLANVMPFVAVASKIGTSFLRIAVHIAVITPYMQSSFMFGVGSL